MLSICGAATTQQIAALWSTPSRQTLLRLRRLEKPPTELVVSAGTISPLRRGRPQLVWTLARNGALQSNGGFHGPRLTVRYFPRGVLLSHVFLESPAAPFVQRVSDRKRCIEELGFEWPFSKGSGAIVSGGAEPTVVLPLSDEEQTVQALSLSDGSFCWTEKVAFRIAASTHLLPLIERLVSSGVDVTDAFVTRRRSAEEWWSVAGRKDARRYRALILRTLAEKSHEEAISLVPAVRSLAPRFLAQVSDYDVGRAAELPKVEESVPKTPGCDSECSPKGS